MAYVDQFARSESLPASTIAELRASLDNATADINNGAHNRKLADTLESLATKVGESKADGVTAKQRSGLAGTMRGIAARLRQVNGR